MESTTALWIVVTVLNITVCCLMLAVCYQAKTLRRTRTMFTAVCEELTDIICDTHGSVLKNHMRRLYGHDRMFFHLAEGRPPEELIDLWYKYEGEAVVQEAERATSENAQETGTL